ncbi:glutamate--tRNA ligase [Patescibacteria group bacterium AH-259-L05]|nr:glutamate--tRNA ligase [Patescibacteria group bacterium AH-259-L05]
MNNVKVRFAPSPTGYLHIGGLRTYLYNWLFAKKHKGKVVLRIEDTDRDRKISGATENIMSTLKRIDLPWDEGPFFQSQKVGDYQNFAQKLIGNGNAYYCFCTSERLEKIRQEQRKNKLPPMYDGLCRVLPDKEVDKKLKSGSPYVVRLKVPAEGTVSFDDEIHGTITVDLKTVDDQILLKSDGWPTYHLANVVDDHVMEITHVIRGEEWLPSVPKHILIYQAFSWDIPTFIHLPLLLNRNKSKLSKRQGDIAVEDYLGKGYLPHALINFLALLGWNPDTDKEIFTLKELISEFSLDQIQKTSAIFNSRKLDWLNGHYIRNINIKKLTKMCIPYLIKSGLIKPKKIKYRIVKTHTTVSFKWLKKIVALEQKRMKRLDQIGDLTEFFFLDTLEYDPHILIWKKMTIDQVKNNLIQIHKILKRISRWRFHVKKIISALHQLAKKQGTGETFWPLRVSLSGRKASPPPEELAAILGKKQVLKRVKQAIRTCSLRSQNLEV